MIGCKVIRTLASVEIEIMLILGSPCCLSSSSVRCLESVRKIVAGSDDWLIDVGHACLSVVHHPLTHTTPVLVPILHKTAYMIMRVPPVMSPGLSAGMAEVASMSDSAFRKRFRSLYDSSPSPTLLVRKRYRGTSELILGTDSKQDDEVEEGLDSDSENEDVEDKGSTTEDDDPAAEDEGLVARVEGPGIDDESYGLDGESHCVDDESHGLDDESYGIDNKGHGIESDRLRSGEEVAVPEGQQWAVLVVGTTIRQGSGFVPKPGRSKRVSAFRQPTLTTWTDPEDALIASPMATSTATISVDEDQFIERYRFRSLEHEQERTAVTFRALWRPVLALEAWAGHRFIARAAGDEGSCDCVGAGEGP
nr:hypothetical protein [Tanacetum cinerariifolium]